MAFDLGAVIVKVKSDLTGFNDGVKKAQKGIKDFSSSVGKSLDSVKKASLVVTGTIVALGAASFKFGETAGKYESIKDSFSSMTKSMGINVEEFEKKVGDASRGTLDRLTILQGGTRALSLIGKDSFKDFGNDFAEMAEYSKKAARATGQDVNYMFDSLITGVSRSSKLILDNLGITVDMEAAYEDYAKSIKKPTQALVVNTKKTEANQAKLSKLKGQLKLATLRQGEFGDKVKESTKLAANMKINKLTGQIGALEGRTTSYVGAGGKSADSLSDQEKKAALLQAVMGKLKETYGDVATSSGGFAGAMSTLKTRFKNAQIQIGTALLPALNEIVRAISPLVEMISNNLSGGIDTIIPKLGNFATAVINIATGFSNLVQGGKDMDGLFDGLKQFMSDKQAFELLDFIQGLADKFKIIGDWISENKELVITFLKGLGIALGVLLIVGTITALLTAFLNPVVLVGLGIAALYTMWKTNFWGIRDTTIKVLNYVKDFFNNTFMPFIQIFVDWFVERWDFIKMIIQGTWDIIIGLIKIAWAIVFGIISTGMEILAGDWAGAWERIKEALGTAWGGIKQVFVGILEFLVGWGGTLVKNLVSPFGDAWEKIKELVEKIKDKMDFTKRHSPSVIDIIENGVRLANKAFEGLEFNTNLAPSVAVSTAQASNPSNTMIGVSIDMGGAIISNEAAAEEMGELIGDNLIKRLQQNIRI